MNKNTEIRETFIKILQMTDKLLEVLYKSTKENIYVYTENGYQEIGNALLEILETYNEIRHEISYIATSVRLDNFKACASLSINKLKDMQIQVYKKIIKAYQKDPYTKLLFQLEEEITYNIESLIEMIEKSMNKSFYK